MYKAQLKASRARAQKTTENFFIAASQRLSLFWTDCVVGTKPKRASVTRATDRCLFVIVNRRVRPFLRIAKDPVVEKHYFYWTAAVHLPNVLRLQVVETAKKW